MANYTAVPAQTIMDFLESKGFSKTAHGNEIVYERSHDKNPQVKVKVYTSIRIGNLCVRSVGGDSIKVCTVLDTPKKSYGLGKFTRIHRVGKVDSVLDRILDRMRAAYARGSEWIEEHPNKFQKSKKIESRGGSYQRVDVKPTPLDFD